MFGIKSIACEYDLRGRKTYEGGATYPVRYEYDSDANISRIDYPDATLAFTHDPDGLLTSASNTVGVVSNEYDASTGWLVSTRGADGAFVSYAHHLGGGVATMASPAGVVSNTLDVAGRKDKLFTPAGEIGFGYCSWNGKLPVVTNANGTITSHAYDVMDRVTNITWMTADGLRIGGFSYVYDTIGRIVSRNHDISTNTFNRSYAYDAMDRLASDGNVSYAYDAADNRIAKTGDVEGDVAYTLGMGNRLQSWTGGLYTYNDASCVTRIERTGKPTLDLTWDSQYQLISVATNGVFAEGYAYDALGRRTATTTLEGTIRHIYDNNWQCIADVDANGNVLRSYFWGDGIGNLLAVKIGDQVYTALTDIQGTIWGFTDGSGEVVARWTYDAWGNILSSDVTVSVLASLRYRFQGREWSAVTGLTNFRMRWYDAGTGRWLSKDPIGLNGGINLYVFCENEPLLKGDPMGEAYIGYRPLDAGGRWQFFNNMISHINLPGDIDPRHAEIFFEDNNDDDKQHRTSHIGYGPTGVHIDTSKVPYNKRDKKQYDDARMREAIEKVKKRPEWEGRRYGFVTHNCQDFVSAVIKEYNNIK